LKRVELSVLYKRTKSGAIQYWQIGARDYVTHSTITKTSGQLGTTSPIVHTENIFTGKNLGKANETSPLQQADLQAQSDWNKKHDEGYKSRQDLGIGISGDLMHYAIDHVNYKTLTEALNAALPKFNTDANGQAKPMLAKTVDWNKVTYPCYVQPKLDGVRCLMVVSKDDAGQPITTFLSRSGKPYTTLDHIKADVDAYMYSWLPNDFILDGEIYSHGELNFQQIVAAVKKQRPDSLKLHFRAYDVVSDEKQDERAVKAYALVQSINSSFVQFVETVIRDTKEEIKELHDNWVSQGYEGAMIRLLDGHYGQGQRSSHLLKVKEFNSTEFTFKCFETGLRDEDLIAVCETTDGKEFRAKMIGNKLSKAVLKTECGELQGAQLTIKHFGWTELNLPRFPIGVNFRDYE